MKRWTVLMVSMMMLVAFGCSSNVNPVAPADTPQMTGGSSHTAQAQTHLWGFFDVYIDIESQTVEYTPNRSVEFAANVVNFLNGNPANLGFNIIDTPVEPDYVGVLIDVSITHPLAGLPQYDGYDVRGIFVGDGSGGLNYDSGLAVSEFGVDQFLLNADGYTRWFNPDEFFVKGLFGYTDGIVASLGYVGSATVNPYKYYADDLGVEDDLWTFMTTDPETHMGKFSSGSTNTRHYDLRFPIPTPNVKYGYAVVANWDGEEEFQHPANTPEAVAISCEITPDIYFIDDMDNGGDLKLEFDLFNWGAQPSTIWVESSVINAATSFDPTTIVTDSGVNYSTYEVEIEADNITQNTVDKIWAEDYWVIAEYGGFDYGNEFEVPNDADGALAAFFRFDLFVNDEAYNQDPICDVTWDESITFPYEGWAPSIEFDASASYDPDPGDVIAFSWDFDGDLVFGDSYESGTDDMPVKTFNEDFVGDVSVMVTDDKGGESICAVEGFDITAYPSKNIPLRDGVDPYDVGVEHGDGDILVLFSDGQVWRYTEADYYQTGTMLYNTGSVAGRRIDVNTNGDSIVAGQQSSSSYYGRSWSATGTGLATLPYYFMSYGVVDVTSITMTTYNGYHSLLASGGLFGYDTWLNRMSPSNYNAGGGNIYNDGTGPYNWVYDGLRGYETSSSSLNYSYFIEGSPDFRLERRSQYWSYAGANVGGSQSDGMTGFNDPKDVTRDNLNNVYVLDVLSDDSPAIKKYSSGLVPDAAYGDSTTISGDPLTIDGGDYNGNLFVIHTDGLSIFFPEELGG